MSLSSTDRAGLIAVVLLAATTHFVYFACSSNYYFPDSATYIAPARTLTEGGGFGEDDETPETMRTPGYPLVLAAFLFLTPGPLPVIVLQHLLACLLAGSLYLLALRQTGSRRIAAIASIALALDIVTIHYANKLLTESLFTVVLFVVIALALRVAKTLRPGGLVALGLLNGALVMIRPVAIAYAGILALFLFMANRGNAPFARREVGRAVALFVVAAVLIPLGWALRNRRETGVLTVSSIAGTNLLLYRAAGALAIAGRGDFDANLRARQSELEGQVRGAIRRGEGVDPDELPHAVLARWYSRAARPVILAHPVAYALLAMRGTGIILLGTDAHSLALVSLVPSPIIRATAQAVTVIVLAMGIAGLVVLHRLNRNLAILIGLTCAYFVIMSAGGESDARFRAPIVPPYVLLAATGIDAALRRRSAAAA